RAQARIVAARHVVRGIVEEAHARRVLEHDRAIARAQLARVRADRGDLHGLGAGSGGGQEEGEGCGCAYGVHVLLLWLGAATRATRRSASPPASGSRNRLARTCAGSART